MKSVSTSELSSHNTPDDCWVAVDGVVYDVTKFLSSHPGGSKILADEAGKDVTDLYLQFHRMDVLKKFGPKMKVGMLEGAMPKYLREYPTRSEIQYADNLAYHGFKSPYFKKSHLELQKAMRGWVQEHIVPNAETWAKVGRDMSDKLFQKMGEAGILSGSMGPGPWIKEFPVLGGVVRPEEFDYFHEQIVHEEMYRFGAPGVSDGFQAGFTIGLPPVAKFKCQDPATTDRVMRDVLSGNKRICLAISEPQAGSDVANVNTTAKKSPCGKFWIVNGSKKWITSGHKSSYFSTAVRTGPGRGGLSFLLIERGPGVTTKKIMTNYSPAAGTSLVILEDAKVPIGNTIGKVGKGFEMIMHNFNHERWYIAGTSLACSRRAVEETTKWLNQRKAFGKTLMKQPHLRQILASMISKTEAMQAYMDSMTYQMNTMSFEEQNKLLGAPICLLKLFCARENEKVQNDAVQLFGGRGLTKTGMGALVQRQRTFCQYQGIYGGTNEVLGDFAVRQMARKIPEWSKL